MCNWLFMITNVRTNARTFRRYYMEQATERHEEANQQIFDVFPSETHRCWLRKWTKIKLFLFLVCFFLSFLFIYCFRTAKCCGAHVNRPRICTSARCVCVCFDLFTVFFVQSCEMRNRRRTAASWQFICYILLRFFGSNVCAVCIRFLSVVRPRRNQQQRNKKRSWRFL